MFNPTQTRVKAPNGRKYVVSTIPIETLVFPADQQGNSISYSEVAGERWFIGESPREGHKKYVKGIRDGSIEIDEERDNDARTVVVE